MGSQMALIFLICGMTTVGLVTIGALVSRKANHSANLVLALLIAMLTYASWIIFLVQSHLIADYPFLIYTEVPLSFGFGVVIFLYVRTLTTQAPLHWKDGLHLAPLILCVGLLVPHWLAAPMQKIDALADKDLQWLKLLGDIHIGGYLTGSLIAFNQYRKSLETFYSEAQAIRLDWLKFLLSLCIGVWALGTFMIMFGDWYPWQVLLGVFVLIYGIAWYAIRQSPVASFRTAVEASDRQAAYQTSALKPDDLEPLKNRVRTSLAEEHLYRQGSLNLRDLSQATDIPLHQLSQVINQGFGSSFYELINHYRVEDAKQRLQDPAYLSTKVLAIGLEAGFSSKSSFNAAFKKMTGKTPSQFRTSLPT